MISNTRRIFLKTLLLCLGGWTIDLSADENSSSPEKKAENYFSAKVLKLDLYAKTKAEEDYIDYVIKLLDDKKISFKVVYAAYKYAMKKKNVQRMYYFAKALPLLSKKAGYKLKFPAITSKKS